MVASKGEICYECRGLFPVVGSGKHITASVSTKDGQLIEDPLVLL